MHPSKHLILGNGIAGQTCAEELRALNPDCEIVMIAKEIHPLYNRVALPRYLAGSIKEENVFLRTPQSYSDKGIDIHFNTSALSVDTNSQIVTTTKGDFSYDSLLIATGGFPAQPPWPGVEDIPLFQFQTIDDANRIITASAHAQNILIVGGSFIAYELAEAMILRGKNVTWMMRGPKFLRYVLSDIAGELCKRMGEEKGVNFVLQDSVSHFSKKASLQAHTENGQTIPFDMLAVGLGLHFYTESIIHSPINVMGGIVTDSHLQTNVPNIYAAGDIAVFEDRVLNKYNQMGTWDNATAMGKTVAHNMLGEKEIFYDVPTYTTTMFGSTMAVMGITPDKIADMDNVSAYSYEEKFYRQLFFIADRLVGAVIIGSPKGRKKLIDIIRNQEKITRDKKDLLDPANL